MKDLRARFYVSIAIILLVQSTTTYAEVQRLKRNEVEPVIRKLEELTKIKINEDNLINFNFRNLEYLMNQKGASVKIRRNGNAKSFGVNIAKDTNGDVLIIPVPGSSLWNSGLTSYVRVNTIDGKDIKNNSIPYLIKRLKKRKQTTIEYSQNRVLEKTLLERKKQHFENLQVIQSNSTLVIRINRFIGGITYDSFLESISKYNLNKIDHVIVDLRYNTGGNVDEAMSIANHFVDHRVTAGYLKLFSGDAVSYTHLTLPTIYSV